jgi:hypothetical protein
MTGKPAVRYQPSVSTRPSWPRRSSGPRGGIGVAYTGTEGVALPHFAQRVPAALTRFPAGVRLIFELVDRLRVGDVVVFPRPGHTAGRSPITTSSAIPTPCILWSAHNGASPQQLRAPGPGSLAPLIYWCGAQPAARFAAIGEEGTCRQVRLPR